MILFKVCTLLCLCITIVSPEEEFGVLLASRSKKSLKRRSRRHGKINSNEEDYSIIISHNISTSLKGIVCSNGKCKNYGSHHSNLDVDKLGDPKWVLKVKDYRYFCYNENVLSCPKFEGVKYKRYKGKKKPSMKKMHPYQTVACGEIYLCYAPKKRLCPHVPIIQTHWKELTIEKVYILEKGVLIIVCLASDIEKCHSKHGSEGWQEEDDVPDSSGIEWQIVSGGIKYYCKAKNVNKCPKIKGSSTTDWKKYCKNGSTEECSNESRWEVVVEGTIIVCVAKSIEECMKAMDATWVPSNRTMGGNGKSEKGRWVQEGSGGAIIYCETNNPDSCPPVIKGGKGWKNAQKGDPDDPGIPEGVWQRKVKGVMIVCVADDIQDCKKLHGGQWTWSDYFRDYNGVPDGARWMIYFGGSIKVYCYSKKAKSCPKLKKGGSKWKPVPHYESEEPDDSKEPGTDGKKSEWHLVVKGTIIVCLSHNIKDCKKALHGKWKPFHREQDSEGATEGMYWVVDVDGGKLYCGAKKSKACPKLKGGKTWSPVGQQKKVYAGDEKSIDAYLIVPELFVGRRYRQTQGDDTVLLCYGKNAKGCPQGGKWIKTTKIKVGEKVQRIISGVNVWVKKQGEKVIVCVAEDLGSCKPGGSGWVIISGPKAGLWQGKSDDIPIYCEAEQESNCPDDIDDWDVITEGGQLDQTKFDLKKKGEIWRLVTFKYTLYCEAKYSAKCPKINNYTWHKVFSNGIDFSSFGKEVNFEKTIGKTFYACMANKIDACPELPFDNKWMEVKQKFTVAVIIEFFGDIPGFEEACRTNGICDAGKKYDPFSSDDDDSDEKKKKKKNRKRKRH